MLTDLNKAKHNSNHKTQQVALDGIVVEEYVYFFMGIVSADVIGLKSGTLFHVLDHSQVVKVEKELKYELLDRFKSCKKKVEKKVIKKVSGWLK